MRRSMQIAKVPRKARPIDAKKISRDAFILRVCVTPFCCFWGIGLAGFAQLRQGCADVGEGEGNGLVTGRWVLFYSRLALARQR